MFILGPVEVPSIFMFQFFQFSDCWLEFFKILLCSYFGEVCFCYCFSKQTLLGFSGGGASHLEGNCHPSCVCGCFHALNANFSLLFRGIQHFPQSLARVIDTLPKQHSRRQLCCVAGSQIHTKVFCGRMDDETQKNYPNTLYIDLSDLSELVPHL